MICLGLDVGASKTHAVLSDEHGRLLGFGTAGGGNWESVGLDGARTAWRTAIDGALKQAGVSRAAIDASGFGLAGLDWPSDEGRLRPVIESLALGGPYTMVNDAFLPLRAGTDDGVGLGAIAGSGATVAGRNRAGEMARSFGASYPFTDWGSAGNIADEAVHRVAAAYAGLGPATGLTETLVAVSGRRDAGDLLEGIMRWEVGITGALAPHVFAVAHAGDAVAISIIERAGTTIGRNVLAVAGRLGMLDAPFVVVTAGGVFSSRSPILSDTLLETVCSRVPHVTLTHWQAPPAVGAVLLAADLIHRRPDRHRLGEETRAALSAGSESASQGDPLVHAGSALEP